MCMFFDHTTDLHSVLFLERVKETGIHFSWRYLICTFGFQGFSVACENPEYISATESSAWISEKCQSVVFIHLWIFPHWCSSAASLRGTATNALVWVHANYKAGIVLYICFFDSILYILIFLLRTIHVSYVITPHFFIKLMFSRKAIAFISYQCALNNTNRSLIVLDSSQLVDVAFLASVSL